jgi:hypothetical protein
VTERAEVVADVAAYVLNHLRPAHGPFSAAATLKGVVYVMAPGKVEPEVEGRFHRGYQVLRQKLREGARTNVLHVCVSRPQ